MAPTKRQLADTELVEMITTNATIPRLARSSPPSGHRKLWIRLRGQGHDVARCTVERIMGEQGWEGARYGPKHTTTIADPTHERYPDLVDPNFCAPAPNRPWVADLTYVPTWTGVVDVAFVIDAFEHAFFARAHLRSLQQAGVASTD